MKKIFHRVGLRLWPLATGLLILLAPGARAATITVTSTADTGGGTLRGAVGFASPGDTVVFANALSGHTILLTGGQIVLGQNVTIDGSALASPVQLNGNGASRIFEIIGGIVTLNSLVITNGHAAGGGGIDLQSAGLLTLNHCTLTGNVSSSDGGGIRSSSGTVALNNCTVANNNAFGAGGGIENNGAGTLAVNESTIYGNSATGGGGIDNNGTLLTVNQSTFSGNTADPASGGGIYAESGNLNLTNTIVSLNSGGDVTGSINSGASNLVGRADISLAPLGNYGGPTQTMLPLPGSPALDTGSDSVTSFLTTDQRGLPRKVGAHVDIGAVELQTTTPPNLLVVNTSRDDLDSFEDGVVSLREAVAFAANNATITFSNTLSGQIVLLTNGDIVLNNSLTIDGSALANPVQLNGNGASRIFEITGGIVTLNSLVITNGNADGGAGIDLQSAGPLTLNNCALTGNVSSSDGGGIRSSGGTLMLNQCTVANNNAPGGGGGVANEGGGTMTMNESTFYGNSATGGGGIDNINTLLTVTQCTFSGNSAGLSAGGGIDMESGTLNLTNTIVSLNNGGDVSGGINSGASNLVGRADINLAPLGNYGGPAQTMPPLPGSPAIDAGKDAAAAAFPTDQRGLPRIAGAHVDVGAVEAGDAIPGVNYNIVSATGDFLNGLTNSGVSLRSATTFASANATITFALALSGQIIPLTNGMIGFINNLTVDGSALPNGVAINGRGVSQIFSINSGQTITLNALTLTNGFASASTTGGAVLNKGTLTINNCTLVGNTNGNAGSGGGAIHNQGTLIANNSTFAENHASGVGGVIGNTATVKVINCTMVGNSAVSSSGGGGIYNNGGTLDLTNSIVAGNTPPGNDIVNAAIFNQTSNLFNVADAQVAPLGNYGGPTPTMPPLPGSPAIDGGLTFVTNFLGTDQRGYLRLSGTSVDLGAVEVQVARAPFVLGGTNGTVGVIQTVSGQTQLIFTNLPGGSFTIFASTNVALPFNTWSNLGTSVESPIGSGRFQFSDPQAVSFPQRFYRVVSP